MSFSGVGGLGNFWHGVVSTAARAPFVCQYHKEVAELFRHFYPRTSIEEKIGQPWLFIPRRPVRPRREWKRLMEDRGGNLYLVQLSVDRFEVSDGGVRILSGAEAFQSKRLWIAAGALNSPAILIQSISSNLERAFISDHIIGYIGQLQRHSRDPSRSVEREVNGFWLNFDFSPDGNAIFVQRPARFDYTKLDRPIENRALQSLTTRHAIVNLFKTASPGRAAEILFNRFGLFPNAKVANVYAQMPVNDAFVFDARSGNVDYVANNARTFADLSVPLRGLTRSSRHDAYLRGIHLHHSVNLDALTAAGLESDKSFVRVVDASVISQIGPEHPTFHVMARAYRLARRSDL